MSQLMKIMNKKRLFAGNPVKVNTMMDFDILSHLFNISLFRYSNEDIINKIQNNKPVYFMFEENETPRVLEEENALLYKEIYYLKDIIVKEKRYALLHNIKENIKILGRVNDLLNVGIHKSDSFILPQLQSKKDKNSNTLGDLYVLQEILTFKKELSHVGENENYSKHKALCLLK